MTSFGGLLTIMTIFLRMLDYYDEFLGDSAGWFGNFRADFFEPGSTKICLGIPELGAAYYSRTGGCVSFPQTIRGVA